jgi:hypothetical protein
VQVAVSVFCDWYQYCKLRLVCSVTGIGIESWKYVESFEMTCLRRIKKIRCTDCVVNEVVYYIESRRKGVLYIQ